MRLLVVDWDFFFPMVELPSRERVRGEAAMFDWGHAETVLNLEVVWPGRASVFLRHGYDLPGTSGQERGFWDRFRVRPHAELYVAESNAEAADPRVADDVTEVLLFDAHHDVGYRGDGDPDSVVDRGVYTCENWMLLYWAMGAHLEVRYPRWRDYAVDVEPVPWVPVNRRVDDEASGDDTPVDRVFVCRSGSWVPPWLDQQFLDFVEACPVDVADELGDYPTTPRQFSREAVELFVAAQEAHAPLRPT